MSSSSVNTSAASLPIDMSARVDILTVAAIAVVTYFLSTLAHEAVGHGLASVLVGLHVQRVTSVDLEVSFIGIPAWKVRVVAAAGCVANLVLAGLAMVLLRVTTRRTPTTRFFLWLLATNNMLIPGGYLMVLTFLGIGDWNDFVQGLPNVFLWQLGLTLLGVLLSFTGLLWGAQHIDQFLGRDARLRGRRVLALTLTAYLAGSAANTFAGILNPTSPTLILISAAASSFGGTVWLLWINAFTRKVRTTTPEMALVPERSWFWIGLGLLALILYLLVLGPGLPRTSLL